MSRAVGWVLGIIVVLALLVLSLKPQFSGPGIPPTVTVANNHVKGVAMAARLYADEHQGRLPSSLSDLVPRYLQNDRPLEGTHLTTPEAVLADLPKETIMLFRVAFPAKGGQPFLIIAHPDGSTEVKGLKVRPARQTKE